MGCSFGQQQPCYDNKATRDLPAGKPMPESLQMLDMVPAMEEDVSVRRQDGGQLLDSSW
jgi:hypothetical protein